MAILHVAFFILEKLEKDKKEGSLIKKLKGDKHLATWRLALSYDVLALLLLQFFFKKNLLSHVSSLFCLDSF